jgi:hypothetical protein
MNMTEASPIPANVQEAMAQLVEYLWDNERRDYSAATAEAHEQHIFPALVRLRRYLFDPTGKSMAFGGCPECGPCQNDGYVNIGRSHWAFCELHRLKWCAGENLVRSWRVDTETEWRENFDRLEEFAEVEPIE